METRTRAVIWLSGVLLEAHLIRNKHLLKDIAHPLVCGALGRCEFTRRERVVANSSPSGAQGLMFLIYEVKQHLDELSKDPNTDRASVAAVTRLFLHLLLLLQRRSGSRPLLFLHQLNEETDFCDRVLRKEISWYVVHGCRPPHYAHSRGLTSEVHFWMGRH